MSINDPISHHKLDGDYTDESTNGTLWDYDTVFVTLGSREVVQFDATADALLLNTAVDSDILGLSVFYRGTSGLSDYRVLFGSTGDDEFIVIRESDGMVGHYNGSTRYWSTTTNPDGEMVHYVLSKNGTDVKIYQNKVLIYDAATGNASSGTFRGIGNIGWTNSRYGGCFGEMKEVYSFDHTLSQADVDDLYEAGEEIVPSGSGVVEVSGSGSGMVSSEPSASGEILLIASGEANIEVSQKDIFSFIYSIQKPQTQKTFKVIYSLEQSKTATVIQRINS